MTAWAIRAFTPVYRRAMGAQHRGRSHDLGMRICPPYSLLPRRALFLRPLQRERHALADAHAHGSKSKPAAALLKSVHRRHGKPRARHAEGMAERDGAAMRID